MGGIHLTPSGEVDVSKLAPEVQRAVENALKNAAQQQKDNRMFD